MLDKTKLKDFIEEQLKDTDCFLTDLSVSPANEVKVEIDSDSRVDLDLCIDLNRAIEQEFPSDDEDYELEVGSAGITSPLKLPRQYRKYIGQDLEVFAADSRKYKGTLISADDKGIVLRISQKVKKADSKRPVEELIDRNFPYSDIRKALYDLKF
ncbi:MAG: ribosome assembly cofactor RimP [Muribaculum sp.]|nr:ribosome assembly cofactor RimP [Muribaculum sp.]